MKVRDNRAPFIQNHFSWFHFPTIALNIANRSRSTSFFTSFFLFKFLMACLSIGIIYNLYMKYIFGPSQNFACPWKGKKEDKSQIKKKLLLQNGNNWIQEKIEMIGKWEICNVAQQLLFRAKHSHLGFLCLFSIPISLIWIHSNDYFIFVSHIHLKHLL